MTYLEKQYQTLILAERDLSLSKSIAQLIFQKKIFDSGELHEGFEHIIYTTSFTVIYARPFLNNKGINAFPKKNLEY